MNYLYIQSFITTEASIVSGQMLSVARIPLGVSDWRMERSEISGYGVALYTTSRVRGYSDLSRMYI